MSSERLYYTDAYLVEFDAVVRDVLREGDRWKVTLDRTAFYPTSGGQPFDTGTLGDVRVLDVIDQEDGSVAHIVDRELEKNSRVRGHVDWERRFDHMQQHTGQHLLSASFERECGARTVSFHLGSEVSTIDLDKELPAEQLEKAEDAANGVLWEDREVCIKFVTAAEAAKLPLRKDPTRTGDLRIVEIKDYDMSACGGTHVSRTGAIGCIVISGYERFKGGQRIEFACGARALRAFRGLKRAVNGSIRLLSVVPADLPAAIEKVQLAARSQQKSNEGLQERLAAHEAASLAAAAETVGSVKLVAASVTGWDANGLKKLASIITTAPATIAVLVIADTPSLIVVARSNDVPVDAGALLKPLLERFGGKGGGRGTLAQAGGMTADPREILNAAREQVRALSAQPPTQ